ncbi:MAG: carbohydrate ABC transporter substrate-binding protein [Clostridia bacterium]|nr:carbohydrate ABC transporter substrate-binding protein [Clostridia bacterium]
MKKFAKMAALLFAVGMTFSAFAGCNVADSGDNTGGGGGNNGPLEEVEKGDYTEFVKLKVDGGGANRAYNTTTSLEYDKYSNPYPYNTLEALIEEWNSKNSSTYGYYFALEESSINNERDTMVPQLNNKTAPEVCYYLPTTIAEDQNKGWFYDLKTVMESPNKYSKTGEAGSVKWKDLYSSEDYGGFFSPDGQLFTVALEKNPIGIMYNKTLFEAAGITETPETFKEFMEVQDKLNAYAKSVGRADKGMSETYITPFFSKYPWYDSYIESSLMGPYLQYLDVINVDGYVDAEEFARGSVKKHNGVALYSPKSALMEEVYRLIQITTKYYPSNFEGYYTEEQFVEGNIAMLEVTGGTIRDIESQIAMLKSSEQFEFGVFPYPVLEQGTGSEYYTTMDASYFVRRGLSGYSTGWAITNSAMAKDTENGDTRCVDACVDLLQWLSCKENNDKMVNDLAWAIPLSGNTEYEHFKSLAAAYEADADNAKSVAWASATVGGNMNKDFYDVTVNLRKELINGKKTISEILTALNSSFMSQVNVLYKANNWDANAWPEYPEELK